MEHFLMDSNLSNHSKGYNINLKTIIGIEMHRQTPSEKFEKVSDNSIAGILSEKSCAFVNHSNENNTFSGNNSDDIESNCKDGTHSSYSDLLSSINYLINAEDNTIISKLPSLIETISNVADDERSDWYVHMLCNSVFAALVLHGKNDRSELLKICYVSLFVLKKIIDKVGYRLVLENLYGITSVEITLNLDDELLKCESIIAKKPLLLELGLYNLNCYDEMYNYNSQQVEQLGLGRDEIILYLKIVDALKTKTMNQLFDDMESYSQVMELLASRGIFRIESDTTWLKHTLSNQITNAQQINRELDFGSIFECYMENLYNNEDNINHFEDYTQMIDMVRQNVLDLYSEDTSQVNRILLNCAIGYIASQNRIIKNRLPMFGEWDVLYLLLNALEITIRDNADNFEDTRTYYNTIRYFELKTSEIASLIITKYSDKTLFDIQSRTYFAQLLSIISWKSTVGYHVPIIEYLKDCRSGILYYAREIDKKLGRNPKYKNRLCIDNGISFELKNEIESIASQIRNKSLKMRLENRESRRLDLDAEEELISNEF